MKKPKAIVFDADGTLLDTFELIVAAYRHVSVTHNLKIPKPEEIRAHLGSPLREMFEAFYPGQNIEQLLSTNNEFVAANTLKSEAFAGVCELLKDLKSAGFKLAVLTSGSVTILSILEHHQLKEFFASIVYSERVQNSKPHPEGFLLACKECRVDPHEAIMVGDTVFDIETGKNSNCFATVAITHGFGQYDDLVSAQPDYIVQSTSELKQILSELA